jgi:MoxR-like ATPase
VLSVEDYSFQALFHDISFKLHAGRFSNFQLEKSELLTKKLFRGETVVLKGEFSAELLAHMETLLTQPAYLYINGEKRVVPGKLILLVEEKKLSACSTLQQCKTLNWLADSQREVAFEEQAEPLANQVFYDESDFVFDPVIPEDSEQQAKDFINSRMLALDLAFEKSSLVSLQGKTGVGKNRLIKQIQQAGVARVYRDLDSVDEWAREDFEDQRTKILFIDEANIEDCQYTFLEPLLPGGNKRLYYNQKFYELDERHKVVFASNPENYGGGRSKPKLFNHSELLVMKLGDFPSCYVYENILKPIYQSMEQPLPESEIKVACQQLMNQFHGDGSLMTVRELQQLALNDCLRISQEQTRASTSTSDIRISLTEASSFIPTEHTRAALQRCEQLLAIKALQAQGKLLNDGVGLNCLLLEGVPGIGKTALFEYCLHKNGYVDAEYATESDSQLYYRIDASLSLEEKREIILTAYHGGGIVWIDELNSCCDEGLEKILNNVLTGEDPRTGAHAVNPGFALLASINGADLEGRAILSPAIYGRSQSVQIDRPSLLDVKTILQARSGSATQARELAEDFVELREECSCLNLRTLVKNEGAAQAIYKQKVLARRPASQPSQAGLWRPLPQNELNLRALVGQDQVAPGSS